MKVVDFLTPDAVIPVLAGTSKPAVLAEMAGFVAGRLTGERPVNVETLRRTLEEREELGSTAIGDGIAIPHGKVDNID